MLYVSIGLIARRLRHSAARSRVAIPGLSALDRLDRAAAAAPGRLVEAGQITPSDRHDTERPTGTPTGGTPAGPKRREMGLMSQTKAKRGVLRNKRSARAEQLAKVLTSELAPQELEFRWRHR